MDGDPLSHGLWESTAPPAPALTPLAGPVAADVAIVGAGFTGLSAALRLAEGGASVVVLEAREVGFGGSGRNVGLVNAGLWMRPDDVAAALGPERGEQLLDRLGRGPDLVYDLVARHGIGCEPVRSGTLHCAAGRAGVREIGARAEQWHRRGAPVRVLDRDAARTATGSHAYRGALLDERAGTIQPLGYVRGLACAAIRAGARVFTGSPVRAAIRTGAAWRLAAGTGEVTAGRVIVATNAYTTSPWGEIRAELVHLPYFNIATVPLPPRVLSTVLPGRQGAWDTRSVLSSFRLDAAGRLVVGSIGAFRGGAAIHQGWARRAIRAVFPQAADAPFEAEWYGAIGMTDDGLPRFHQPAPGILSASGYNGRGIAPGTVFGQVLADHLLGRIAERDLPLPISGAAPARARRAREALYAVGSQAVHLLGARRIGLARRP